MDNGTEAAAERIGEGVAVEEVCDGFADVDELRRSEVALEHDLAVAVAFILREVEAAVVDEGKCVFDLRAFCKRRQQVDFAGLQRVEHRFGNDLLVDDLFDVRLLALIVALVVIVDHEDGFVCRLVVGLQGVRAAGEAVVALVAGGIDRIFAVGKREVFVEVCAFALIGEVNVRRQPHGAGQRSDTGVNHFKEVRQVVCADGDGELIVAEETDAGERTGRFFCADDVAGFVSFSRLVEFGVADELEAVAARSAELNDHRRGEEKDFGNIVFRGDGGAIVPLQILCQVEGEGLRAVCVCSRRDLCNVFIVDIFGVAGQRNRRITADEVADVFVCRVVRPLSIAPVA